MATRLDRYRAVEIVPRYLITDRRVAGLSFGGVKIRSVIQFD